MKDINTPLGKPWKTEALPPFPHNGTRYLTLLSRYPLVRATLRDASSPLTSLGNENLLVSQPN
jgi:hypothetical protein